jgi:hypothetical protein
MVRVYAGDAASSPLVNVLGADLRGLPPATVITCGYDVLRADGVRLAEALRAAGVQTLHTHHDDMPHGFLMFSRLTRRAGESMDEMAREAGKRLGTADASSATGAVVTISRDPRFYAVNDRPVSLVPTAAGGEDCLVFDFATGEMLPDRSYFEYVTPGSGRDVDALTEAEFDGRLAACRAQAGATAAAAVRERAEQLCATTSGGTRAALDPAGRLLTRDVLDASLGPGRELPIYPDSRDEGHVAYTVTVPGVPVACRVNVRFRRGAAAYIDLRTEHAS